MITRRKLLKLTLASLAVPALHMIGAGRAIVSADTEHLPKVRAELAEPPRRCPTLVLDTALGGLNRPWTRTGELRAGVCAVKPQAVGYPGHHLADYWDWQTGWIDVPALQGVMGLPPAILDLLHATGCVDLNELKALISAASTASGASVPVLFTANMITRNRRLTQRDAGSAVSDAAAGKAFLLSGLQACAARGIDTRWLVLGDSLAGEQNWMASPAGAVFRGDTLAGTTDYPQVALDWASAARQYNPNLNIAAFATGTLRVSDASAAQWNTRLVASLAGQSSIRALAASLAFPGGMGVGAGERAEQQKQQYALLKDPQALRALFSQPPAALQEWLNQPVGSGKTLRGCGLRLWLNALHLEDPIGALRYTWAHGLLIAYALQSALREPAVDLIVLHNTADPHNAAFFSSIPLFNALALGAEDGLDYQALQDSIQRGAQTVLGQIFALFLTAARGASTAQALSLAPLADPLVWGWAFNNSAGRPKSVLLGNLSESAAQVDLSAVWAAVGGVMEGQVFQAAPGEFITRASSQPGTPFALHSSAADTQADGLEMPPYSLALLSGLRLENELYLPHIRK